MSETFPDSVNVESLVVSPLLMLVDMPESVPILLLIEMVGAVVSIVSSFDVVSGVDPPPDLEAVASTE